MGPADSPFSRVGVEITDSPYVVANMRIMTRMGRAALEQLAQSDDFVPGLHSIGELDPERRYICHFPEERLIWSYGSGYGGNALLGKKCFALRIASAIAREEGWLAEHMLLLELTDPRGERTYFAAAFPSACGKTNLAMLVSPLADRGYTVRTIGDDIAWMRIGADGRLWAINPEAGFFGVVPGTSRHTNPNALAAAHANTIYTNVAVDENGIPWWEGKGEEPAGTLTDWKGRIWSSGGGEPAAHPNSRFTAPARQNPGQAPRWEDPQGVPISGILFGGRRNHTVPLVAEAFDWQHGVFFGATMASRTTAAATGATNVLRRDPMAMLPFCGYHMGDYFAHWLTMGKRIARPPAIFQVNWFRRDADGNYLWPGYGDNIRVLIWMHERIQGRGKALRTPVGFVPTVDALHRDGLDIPTESLELLLHVDPAQWGEEADDIEAHFARFGERLPPALREELDALRARLRGAGAPAALAPPLRSP
jgi:phosphoenolpyruvate carboxykinase (GTP)